MFIKHFFTLLTMFTLIIIGDFVCPSSAWPADEYRLRLSMKINDSTLKPTQVQPPPSERVKVLEKRRISGKIPRQRNVELSSQHLVVIGLDENGKEIDRVLVNDPRLIRAEIFDQSGNIVSKKLFYRENAEFSLVFKDDPSLRVLKFYHPNWTGTKFVLELIGETQVSTE
jgi:hypothetical protein